MKRTKKNEKQEKCLKILNTVLTLAIISTSIYYVTIVNDLTVKGFKLQELKEQKQALQRENKHLNLKITSLRSYGNLAQKTKDLNMVSATNIEYVTTMDEMMARK